MDEAVLTVREIAETVGGTVDGDDSARIVGIASVDAAGADELTFAADEKREAQLQDSKAGVAIVRKSAAPASMPLIRVENVQEAMARLLTRLEGPADVPPVGVHETAVISDSAEVSPETAIGPHVVVGPRAKVGPGCVLCAHVTIGADVVLGKDVVLSEGVIIRKDCVIGDRVRIGPNSVVGFDGFGYYFSDGVHHKFPHIGNVVIEEDVEIGACSCIDRAKFGSTHIGPGTKIDNLVQVAHNVQVGRGCILAAQCGIAGSTKLGDYVVIMGHSGIRDNVTVGDKVQCAAFAAIAGDIPDGAIVSGIPARNAREHFRIIAAWGKLPKLLKRVRSLELKVRELESPEDN